MHAEHRKADYAGERCGSQPMRSVTRIAVVITEMIKHTTHEQSLVVASHVNYGESDDSMARPTSSRCHDLGAAAQQEERGWSQSSEM